MKKILLSLTFIMFSFFQLFSIDFSKLDKNQINDIKKAVDILTVAALENETIELAFTLSIIPFFKKSNVKKNIEFLENNSNHPLYDYKKKIIHAYEAGQDYVKNLSKEQKESQVKEIELAYRYLNMLGLQNMTKKEILNSLKEASLKNQDNLPRDTDTATKNTRNKTESMDNFFINNDSSDKLIDALKILEIDPSKLKKLIPATLIDDYYKIRSYEYEEVGKYSDQDFEKIEKAYSYLKSKVFHFNDPKK